MKKKKVFSKILAIVLVLSLMLSAFPNLSVFAQESSSKEKLTEKGELWQPESNPNALNFEGDLSIEELQGAKLNDEDTPEIVGQDNIEEKGHVNRLWEQEEDLNSIVFQNRDGTKTMYYYNYPVKYKDANGKIKDKSNKITQTSSGDYTNAENDINTYFPKKLNRNKGIELKFGEYVVEMAPDIKGNSGASRQTGHNKYFDLTEYVQYQNVFDESISLRYTPTFEGYKEDIVLSKYTGINEFSFRLYTDGLSLVMNEDGAYILIDPLSGEVKTQIGDLVVYDSKPFDVPEEILNESVSNPTEEDFAKKEATLKELIESVPIGKNETGELSTNLKEYFHQYKVETVKQDNEYLITVVVDEDYLTDSERVYPVYVDPTISVSGSGTGKTIQDAPIYANKPSTASGGNTYNVVGYQGSTYGVGRTLMKFPGLSSNSTYANLPTNQITSLQLHIYEGSGSTNNACIDLWQYNGTSWTESTARCNNVGWDSYSNNFTWNYINCSGWQTFNLTSMVATWKGSSSALDKGIMLKNYTSESSSGYSKHFMSTESSYKPYLTFTYKNLPTTETSGIIDGASYYVQNEYSALHMDIYNGNTNVGTRLIQYALNGAKNQKIKFDYISNGEYELVPSHSGGKVLTANSSGNIFIDEDCNLSTQRWYVYKSGSYYYFVNKYYSNQKMSVNASSSNGAYVTLSNSSGYLWKLGGANITISNTSYNAGVRATIYNSEYYYDYTTPLNNLFASAKALCEDHRCMNWAQYCEWCYNISILYEPSLSEHAGMQLGSFTWFYSQVNHNAVWDIKREARWNAALPNVPYLGLSTEFIFRGYKKTAEDMGNIMYGYTGRATGFGEVTLYWGGGVAAQGSLNNSAVNTAPFYGDAENDHYNIELGYDLFDSDYPSYPDVGYDGIPVEEGIIAAVGDLILNPGT